MRHAFVGGYSRSGTTLLTTILDSHPEIAMGYELMPTGLPSLDTTIATIEAAEGDPADTLRQDPGTRPIGVFLVYCKRARVEPDEVVEILKGFRAEGMRSIGGLKDRSRVAMAVVERKRAREGAAVSGFKANTPRVSAMDRYNPESAFVFIARDPRDVLASQMARSFDRPPKTVASHWSRYVSSFRRFMGHHPDRAVIVRYEDLVTERERSLDLVFGAVGLPYGDEVIHFYESNASIHGTHHNNAKSVSKDLFTTSIGRWVEDLEPAVAAEMSRRCSKGMAALGYE